MAVLILGLVVFFAVHSLRMLAPGFRDRQLGAVGERRWKGLYSLASLVGFVLIIWGWSLARPAAAQLYVSPDWGRHVTMALVWLGFVSIASAYQPAGRIKASLRNPFLVGILMWSAGHLLANGDLASVVLFGAFFVYAALDLVSVSRRGEPAPAFSGYRGDLVSLVAGTVLYVIFVFWLHAILFGVSPLS